jgi:hypothetical protein
MLSYVVRGDTRAEPYRTYLAGKEIGVSFSSLHMGDAAETNRSYSFGMVPSGTRAYLQTRFRLRLWYEKS